MHFNINIGFTHFEQLHCILRFDTGMYLFIKEQTLPPLKWSVDSFFQIWENPMFTPLVPNVPGMGPVPTV